MLLVILTGCNQAQTIEKSGGLRVIMSINPQELVHSLSLPNLHDPCFDEALQLASVRQETTNENYIDLFVEEYRKLDRETPLAAFFHTFELRESITPESSDCRVISVLKDEFEKAIANSFNILRSRISRFGITSGNIQLMETPGHILVELPGIKEPRRILNLLQSNSNLEFWETYHYDQISSVLEGVNDYLASVSDVQDPLFSLLQISGAGGPVIGYAHQKEIDRLNEYFNLLPVKQMLPRDLVFKWGAHSVSEETPIYQLYAIKLTRTMEPPLNGEVIVDAMVTQEYGFQVINLTMNSKGANLWARLTLENIGKSIALVMHDRVFSAPIVQEEITEGRVHISGLFTAEEAKDLTILLKSGRMLSDLTIIRQELVPKP
ncbi:MAG: hypothetical protein LUE98_13620 [Tannerellaceae bacterium]|nr:hypothetical protein [Tannerellaceae bacterium]